MMRVESRGKGHLEMKLPFRKIRTRTTLMLTTLLSSVGLLSVASPTLAASEPNIVIAEPLHSMGYLPLYVAIDKGLFKGINVTDITLTGGSAHTNAVLTGQAWGFIGGPEHNAFAAAQGAALRAIVNVVNRGNVYLVARPGLTPSSNLKQFFLNKTIVTSQYGGTPDSIARYLIARSGLTIGKNVTLLEVDSSAIPVVMGQKRADIAVASEPTLTQGIKQGIWEQPFYNVPQKLGPYAYSTVNVALKTIQTEPQVCQAFVNGMLAGLAYVKDNHIGTLQVAMKEFPSMSKALVQATLNRSYADHLWEYDGKITPAAVKVDLNVVIAAGLLKSMVPFKSVVDTQFLH